MFELVEHTADLGLRITADSLDQLFEDAARGLFTTIVGNINQVRLVTRRALELPSAPIDYLLVDWLSELLYTFEAHRLLLAEFAVSVGEGGLKAQVQGEAFDPQRHRLEHEVKAITYHRLQVVEQDGRWRAEVVLDI